MKSIKRTFREMMRYPSAVMGMVMILILLVRPQGIFGSKQRIG